MAGNHPTHERFPDIMTIEDRLADSDLPDCDSQAFRGWMASHFAGQPVQRELNERTYHNGVVPRITQTGSQRYGDPKALDAYLAVMLGRPLPPAPAQGLTRSPSAPQRSL